VKHDIALTVRNRTVRRAVSTAEPATGPARRRPTAHTRYRRRQTTDYADRRQRAKQYWPIRWASKKFAPYETDSRLLATDVCAKFKV